MVRLLPAMPSEPPERFVAFVARHLDTLRRDAARVVGDDRDADELYPDVLTDVAVHWRWLDLMQTRLGRAGASERYLRDAFERRSARWRSEDAFPVDIEVWPTDRTMTTAQAKWAAVSFGGGMGVERYIQVRPVAPARTWSSVALRLAAHVTPGSEFTVGPVAEAAIAWWHAYEAMRRRRIYAACMALLALTMLITRLRQGFL